MKSQITILFFFITSLSFAQVPFPDTLAVWSNYYSEDSYPICNSWYEQGGYLHYFGEDTTVNGVAYNTIYRRHTWRILTIRYYPEPYAPCMEQVQKGNADQTPFLIGGLRNEGRQVYFKSLNQQGSGFIDCSYSANQPSGEILLYDFDIAVGDTVDFDMNIITDEYIVIEIDSIVLGGVSRKVYHFQDKQRTWIEGIGSAPVDGSGYWGGGGLFGPYTIGPFEGGCGFDCFQYDGNYLLEGFQCDTFIISPIKEALPSKQQVDIYPNPATEWLSVKFEKQPKAALLQVYDVLGNMLREFPINEKLTRLDLAGLPEGVLLIAVFDEEGLLYQKKVLRLD